MGQRILCASRRKTSETFHDHFKDQTALHGDHEHVVCGVKEADKEQTEVKASPRSTAQPSPKESIPKVHLGMIGQPDKSSERSGKDQFVPEFFEQGHHRKDLRPKAKQAIFFPK